MTADWVSVSVTLAIFVISHIIITVWWAAKVSTILNIVQSELKELIVEFKLSRDIYFTKVEAQRELAITEKEHKVMWKRIDELTKTGG